ncbi:hypothetical protein NBG84_04930 [Streptomyces sp. CWNU-1]|uniref:Uncharacterized protein n=1 Tax=Streptomyces albipurpureus TaxID=2897419 RepID=A0ABT0UG97_9ACTN|nr:hypothetical protein [Streptomyces sp. CWNU-1]MCM2387658.1 hypothetical protein [Streptomyces sp. CWNU-1]
MVGLIRADTNPEVSLRTLSATRTITGLCDRCDGLVHPGALHLYSCPASGTRIQDPHRCADSSVYVGRVPEPLNGSSCPV